MDKAKKTGMGEKFEASELVGMKPSTACDNDNSNLVADKNNNSVGDKSSDASQKMTSVQMQNDEKPFRSDSKNWRARNEAEDQLSKLSVDMSKIDIKSEPPSPLCTEQTPMAGFNKDHKDNNSSPVDTSELQSQHKVMGKQSSLQELQKGHVSFVIRGQKSNLPRQTIAPDASLANGSDKTCSTTLISPTLQTSFGLHDSSDSSVSGVKQEPKSPVAEQSTTAESISPKKLSMSSTTHDSLTLVSLVRPPLNEIQPIVIAPLPVKESVEPKNKTPEMEKLGAVKSSVKSTSGDSKSLKSERPLFSSRPMAVNYSGLMILLFCCTELFF